MYLPLEIKDLREEDNYQAYKHIDYLCFRCALQSWGKVLY